MYFSIILSIVKWYVNYILQNFNSFLDVDVPLSTSYRVYISQLIQFARAFSHVAGFNTRNLLLTQKLL